MQLAPTHQEGGESSRQLPTVARLEPLVVAASEHCGGEASLQEILDFVSAEMRLTPEQLSVRHKDGLARRELDYRLAWTRTKLRGEGRITRVGRGIWCLGPSGSKAS